MAAAAAAGERRGGSDSRLTFAPRRSPLVLLLPLLPLLLLPARPALGNEGGAAGSCRCEKYSEEPPLVKRFAHRLVSWKPCLGLIRFEFPKHRVCGFNDAPWVLRLISLHAEKLKGAARVSPSQRCCQPSPTSPALLQPLSSVRSTREVPRETPPSQQLPKETPPSQQLPALTTTMATLALESVRSLVLPRNGAVAEVSPTQLAQEESVPGWHHQTTVLSALGIIVLLLVMAGLLCWWRPPRRGRWAALPSEQQVCMLQRPGEGPTCSLGAHAAAASGWGG